MRIRKNASKLLGFASVYANPWLAPPSPVIAAADCSEIVCELNCSPWDVMVMDPNSYCCTNLERAEEDGGILGNLTNSEVEEDGGILGNLMRTEEEEPICAITSNAAELSIKAFTVQISETKVEKIERKKKSKGKEKAAAEKIIAYCKKSDGKGWQCKRPAQLPHTLCSYHLAQIRSYSHRTPDASTAAAAADSGKNHQTKEAAAAAGSDLDSNLYYYYDGFGPLRGKRRGRDRDDIVNAEVKKEEKQDGSSRESDDDDIVAGDDEYDLDCFDDYDDDNFSLHVQDDEEINGKKEGDDQEQKKMVEVKKKKKRGRKPIKARSLKSLL